MPGAKELTSKTNTNPGITVVVPVHINHHFQFSFLVDLINSLEFQIVKPFEILFVEDSTRPLLLPFLDVLRDLTVIKVRYLFNESEKGISSNTNFGISQVKTDLIHILHQDDYLINPTFYADVEILFANSSTNWLLAGGEDINRRISPKITKEMILGFNDVGGPSAVVIKNLRQHVFFDPKLTMLLDVDFYFRCQKLLGDPQIYDVNSIHYRIGQHQTQVNFQELDFQRELIYILSKHKIGREIWDIGLRRYEAPRVVLNLVEVLLVMGNLTKTKKMFIVNFLYLRNFTKKSHLARNFYRLIKRLIPF